MWILPSTRKNEEKLRFLLFCDFLITLKTEVNVVSNYQKKNLNLFVAILRGTEEKSSIRIRNSVVLYGSAYPDPYPSGSDP